MKLKTIPMDSFEQYTEQELMSLKFVPRYSEEINKLHLQAMKSIANMSCYQLPPQSPEEKFKYWLERLTTPDILNSFKKLENHIRSMMPFLKKANDLNIKKKIGEVTIVGRKIPIYVGKIDFTCHKNCRVLISYDDDFNKISNSLWYELRNITKCVIPKWQAETLPEFDTMTTDLTEIIKLYFNAANDDDKSKIIKGITTYAASDSSDSSDYFPYISPDAIRQWKTKPTLWRNFQSKIWNLAQDLKEELHQSVKHPNSIPTTILH